MNGVGKICWAGRDFNCIQKVCGFVTGQGRWAENLSAPSHCWVLWWNVTLSNRQKNQLFQADREVGLLFVLISHQCMRSSKICLPECWLKELIFPELSYSLFSSIALDKHFELGVRWYFYGGIEKKKNLERFQYHFSNVCFLQNDTKRCFLSICRGTARSYLYEKIMVTKILLFFSTEC